MKQYVVNTANENYFFNNKFDEVLEKQRAFNPNYEDDLIEIGVLKNKALKKVDEFEKVIGEKSNYDSESEIENKFTDYLAFLSKILDMALQAKSPQLLDRVGKQLEYVYSDTKEVFEKIISRNEMMIKVEKSSGNDKVSLLTKLTKI